MVKKIIQDVTPPNKKSIRHIPLPLNRRPPIIEREEKKAPAAPRHVRRDYGVNIMRWGIIVGSLVLLLVVILFISWFFSSATVTVTPKQATATIDAIIQADTANTSGLHYTIISATTTAYEIIPTNREADVQKKASGQIVVYNNYSTESQRLIKNTRFEAADGRIYRIDTSVTVPGQKVEGGKKVPGSLVVTVYADAAGPEYNLPISDLKGDFSVPGFKGTPRYEAFYARQKTDIVGGFSGKARVVDEKTLEATENTLKAKLSEELWKSLTSSTPAGFVLFPTLFTTDFTASSKDNSKGDGVEISVTATGHSVAFDALALSAAVATRSLSGLNEKETVLIGNMDELSVLPSGQDSGQNIFDKSALVLNVKGNVHFIWQFDDQALKNDLEGRKKEDTKSIMGKYPAIVRAEVVVKPPWLSKYPSNLQKIHIVQRLDQQQ